MKIGFTGSSMNNRDFLSGSAVPLVGLMNVFNEDHQVFWLERNPDELSFEFSPVPVKGFTKETLHNLALDLKLDLLIIQTWTPYPALTAKLFKEKGTKIVYWDDNTPYAQSRVVETAQYADLILTHGDGAKNILAKKISDEVPIETFYFATDPERFSPSQNRQFKTDVVFVGTHMEERTDQLKKLFFEPSKRMKKVNFTLYGNGWRDWPELESYPVDFKGWAKNENLNEIYYNAKITLNATKKAFRKVDLIPSNRIFDVMASGGVLLSDPLPKIDKLFEVGKDLLIAKSSKEAQEKIMTLLSNQEFRESISRRAREAVIRMHTWRHRKKKLLSLI